MIKSPASLESVTQSSFPLLSSRLGTYARTVIYVDLMNYWHELYPGKIYDISYEELTSNQEKESRQLIDYCDLEWDPLCLDFHENKRDVKTASALQVRKKMYQGSSDAWKEYSDYLTPLNEALNPNTPLI